MKIVCPRRACEAHTMSFSYPVWVVFPRGKVNGISIHVSSGVLGARGWVGLGGLYVALARVFDQESRQNLTTKRNLYLHMNIAIHSHRTDRTNQRYCECSGFELSCRAWSRIARPRSSPRPLRYRNACKWAHRPSTACTYAELDGTYASTPCSCASQTHHTNAGAPSDPVCSA